MRPITARRLLPSGDAFPFVGVALIVLIAHAILVATIPPNPYRSAVAIAALFATGYCALALIAGQFVRLSAAEILAFSVGLTILITALSALVVSISHIPITDFAITVIGLPIAAAAWLLRRPYRSSWKVFRRGLRTVFDFSDYSRSEKAIAGVLLAAIAVALTAFILLSTVMYPDTSSPGLALVGPDGTPGSLPDSFNRSQPKAITVTVLGGQTSAAYELRIRLIPSNATGNEAFHPVPAGPPLHLDPFAEFGANFTLAAGKTWTQEFSVVIDAPGSYELRFELLDATSAVVAFNHLFVTVA